MGWTVNVVENTLKTSEATFEKLYQFLEELGHNIYQSEDGTVNPDDDAMEWIDFLSQEPDSIEILKADPETSGRICFADDEGDNAGDSWGHEFENGEYYYLVGQRTFVRK
jgi:hypothetical protein